MIFVGIDWAEKHHDVCIIDKEGAILARGRVADGVEGISRLHEMVASHIEEPEEAIVGIELDRGLLVGALVAAGYEVFAINPLSVDRYRDRHSTSGAKSDPGDAKVLADIVQANSDKDGNLMVQLGYAQVSAGQADAGLKLIEQGIAKDKLKRPEDAKLHLGIAQLLAGKKAKAQQTLRSVGGTDGTADLARLWIIQSNQGNQQ